MGRVRGETGSLGWFLRFRDRINLGVIDAATKQPVRLPVGGPHAAALVAALDPAGTAAAGVLTVFDGKAPFERDSAARCALYTVDSPGAVAPREIADSGRPIFIVERVGLSSAAHDDPDLASQADRRYRVAGFQLAELRKRLLPDIAEAHRGAEIALAASLPAFRGTVVNRLVGDCATRCLKVAAASALADHIPIIGLLTGGIASATDTVAITGLQINMLLHIAAAYGKKAEFARIIELVPVIGGGYGWRALARELAGFIPVAGIAIKAAIAYAGTYVVGQAAAQYYETGNAMTAERMSAVYREGIASAKTLARQILSRSRKDG